VSLSLYFEFYKGEDYHLFDFASPANSTVPRLWRADYEKPVRTGHSKARCSSTAFPKMFICRLRLAQPQSQKGKMQNSYFSSDVYAQRSRNAGFSCYNVTPLPLLHPVYLWE
jgi:hypothetical protein